MKKCTLLLSLLMSSCLSSQVRQGITVEEDAGVVEDVMSSMLSSDEITINECVDTCTNRCPIIEPKVIVKTIYVTRLPSVARFSDDDGIKMEMKE